MFQLRIAPLLVSVVIAATNPVATAAQVRVPRGDVEQINLTGPRIGFTHLSAGARARLAERGKDPGAVISQVGWHSEVIHTAEGADVAVVGEMVSLLGGLDRGTPVVSLSWLFGLRGAEGFELGAGPTWSTAGSGYVFAVGGAIPAGFVDIPIHLAVATSNGGPRVSLLSGWAVRRNPWAARNSRLPTITRPLIPYGRPRALPHPFGLPGSSRRGFP